jgi:hypothetical protein
MYSKHNLFLSKNHINSKNHKYTINYINLIQKTYMAQELLYKK